MLKIAYSALAALCVTSAVAADETAIWKDNVQGWTVVVDRTIDNSCFIISGFENELFLRFQFNAIQQSVQMIVANIHWKSVQNGEDYDLDVAFGDRDSWSGTAKGHRWQGILPSLVLSVPVAENQASHFMREFMEMGSVSISYDGSEIADLPLRGADKAVASMLDCQAAMSKANNLTPASDPFAVKSGQI